MLTNRGAILWYEISAQGTTRLQHLFTEKFVRHNHFTIVKRKSVIQSFGPFFGYATLIAKRLFDGLLWHPEYVVPCLAAQSRVFPELTHS